MNSTYTNRRDNAHRYLVQLVPGTMRYFDDKQQAVREAEAWAMRYGVIAEVWDPETDRWSEGAGETFPHRQLIATFGS
jgi:hypothetical protein